MTGPPSLPPPLAIYRTPNVVPASKGAASGNPAPPHPHPSPSLIHDGEVRGLCSCYHEREDVTAAVLEGKLQLEEVEERCVCALFIGTDMKHVLHLT